MRKIDADKLVECFDDNSLLQKFSVGYFLGVINGQPTIEEMKEKKRDKFIVYLKNGEFYTYSVHDYEWFIAPELHCMYVVDVKDKRKRLIVNIDDFSRVEVVEDD